jgi:hypothetical protein
MRSRTVSDASAPVPIRSERKIEDPRPATRRDYYEAADATFLALAASGQEHDPSHEGPLGCQIDLLEEFLDVLAQVPNVTMPKKQ